MSKFNECPVPPETLVFVKMRGAWTTSPQPAVKFLWSEVEDYKLRGEPNDFLKALDLFNEATRGCQCNGCKSTRLALTIAHKLTQEPTKEAIKKGNDSYETDWEYGITDCDCAKVFKVMAAELIKEAEKECRG